MAFYKQVNNKDIKILCKDELIYHKNYYCHNYINNIIKHGSLKYIQKANIAFNYISNFKRLYYKKDNKINCFNSNFITFDFIYNKYLNKNLFY